MLLKNITIFAQQIFHNKHKKEVKAKIKELYQLCDDEGLSVMFDYEIESENKMYEQLEKD